MFQSSTERSGGLPNPYSDPAKRNPFQTIGRVVWGNLGASLPDDQIAPKLAHEGYHLFDTSPHAGSAASREYRAYHVESAFAQALGMRGYHIPTDLEIRDNKAYKFNYP
jgi:hypothetical protein